jgi:cobalt transporter subunit CbtA
MLRRILLTALVAGAAAGLVAAILQRIDIVPLIAQAEIYEAAGAGHAHEGPQAWEPEPGFERAAYTVLADLLTGIGFALLLTGAIALSTLAGRPIDAKRGLLWGAAGFAAFTLAPALGLPPELPGMAGAALAQRQAWWLGTAAATAVGLGLIAFRAGLPSRLAGVALLVLPHLIGAPEPASYGGNVPPELAARFVVASIATAALFWLALGAVSGWLYRRLDPAPT